MHLNLVVIKKINTIEKCFIICTIVPPIMFETYFSTTISRIIDSSCAWFPQ